MSDIPPIVGRMTRTAQMWALFLSFFLDILTCTLLLPVPAIHLLYTSWSTIPLWPSHYAHIADMST